MGFLPRHSAHPTAVLRRAIETKNAVSKWSSRKFQKLHVTVTLSHNFSRRTPQPSSRTNPSTKPNSPFLVLNCLLFCRDSMHQPMFPANGLAMRNGIEGPPKAFSDDTKILGYDPVIMPALIQAELPLVPSPQHLFHSINPESPKKVKNW